MSAPITYTLDYLFIAEAENGTVISQTPDDVSRLDPTKSSFYDVLQNLPLKKFTLVGKGHLLTVDFTDGHIEIDGRSVYSQRPPEKGKIEPIYYRKVQQMQRVTVYEDGFRDTQPTLPAVRYYIGWQTTYSGKNYKFELGVD